MVLRPSGNYVGGSGGHHLYESIKNGPESFRLRDSSTDDVFAAAAAADPRLNDDASSIASKKRIDSMFRAGGDETKPGGDRSGYGYGDDESGNRNTVQEKIEQMFAEVGGTSELDTDASVESATAVGSSKYHVQYIGCAGLSAKISSLEGLQRPVRDLYFGYRERRAETRRDFSGLLDISAAGLTIRYRDEETGESVHRTNAFPSIAVWAALKYVCRRRSATGHGAPDGYEYAFLPLIADPDGSDKAPLFRHVDAGDRSRLDAAGDHAPVFAVVTRESGKRLECHGFACETENDALLMAANLYGALVAAMSTSAAAAASNGDAVDDAAGGQPKVAAPEPRRVIRQRNGFTSMSSTAGSSVGGGDVGPPALPPPRPPRRNKKSSSSTKSSSECGDGGGSSEVVTDDVCGDAKTFRMTVRQPPSLRRGVCNSGSATTARGETAAGGGGDILTKVAIPRSRSFLGLASSKYPRRTAGCGIESAADRRRRRSNSSGVMGFSDMFNELRLQEGLSNMDDILNAIIDVEGMSYNDLKPLYREFLTKLAMTLTKDELYQRTKVIMTEQKRRRKKRRPTVVTSTAGRGRRLNEKLRAAKSRIGAALLPDICKRDKRKPAAAAAAAAASRKNARPCSCIANGASSSSSSSVEARLIDRKSNRKTPLRRAGARAAAAARAPPSPARSTSDDSDLFLVAALRQRQHKLQRQQLYRKSGRKPRDGVAATARGVARKTAAEVDRLHRTSSGYFSCSECSAADDKCYCGTGEPASVVSCSCDSDSCADSDKCYCGRSRRPRNIFDELKSRGFAASESSVSRADSPGTAWKKNELLLRRDDDEEDGPGGLSSGACNGGGIEPSKSLEYLQMTRRPAADQQRYSNVAKSAYGRGLQSSSSSSTSCTVYSSSSVVGAHPRRHRQQQRRSGSSGSSDNFRAIDYALFAANGGGSRKPPSVGGGGRLQHSRPHHRDGQPVTASVMNRRSYSTEAVYRLTGGGVYREYRGQAAGCGPTAAAAAARRHSVHDGGGNDVLSSFFKSGIENSLGYYP